MTCPCKEHGLSEVPFFDGTRIFVPAAFLPEHFWLIRSFTEHGLTEVPYFYGTGIFVPAAFLPEHFWLIRSFTEHGTFRIFTEREFLFRQRFCRNIFG
jgi:hypothetical protein